MTGGKRGTDGFWQPYISSEIRLWSPPAGAASVLVKECRVSRLKRKGILHILMVPKVMTTLWLKQLHKLCDIVFEIPAGASYWPNSSHKPLVIGFVFTFSKHDPWSSRRTQKILAAQRKL